MLGHPEYDPRFGFEAMAPAVDNEYGGPPEAFVAVELWPGALDGAAGTVRYHRGFAG